MRNSVLHINWFCHDSAHACLGFVIYNPACITLLRIKLCVFFIISKIHINSSTHRHARRFPEARHPRGPNLRKERGFDMPTASWTICVVHGIPRRAACWSPMATWYRWLLRVRCAVVCQTLLKTFEWATRRHNLLYDKGPGPMVGASKCLWCLMLLLLLWCR